MDLEVRSTEVDDVVVTEEPAETGLASDDNPKPSPDTNDSAGTDFVSLHGEGKTVCHEMYIPLK